MITEEELDYFSIQLEPFALEANSREIDYNRNTLPDIELRRDYVKFPDATKYRIQDRSSRRARLNARYKNK